MIYFNLNLRHPNWVDRFKNIKVWHGPTPLKNKYWEIQLIKNDNLISIEFGFTEKQDHAGLNLELGLLGYETHFTIYDNRHWNYETNDWAVYDEKNLL